MSIFHPLLVVLTALTGMALTGMALTGMALTGMALTGMGLTGMSTCIPWFESGESTSIFPVVGSLGRKSLLLVLMNSGWGLWGVTAVL
jgi:hypothetical protein